jgi:hypothetical protein
MSCGVAGCRISHLANGSAATSCGCCAWQAVAVKRLQQCSRLSMTCTQTTCIKKVEGRWHGGAV